MNSVLRFIALAMFLALAISATTGTFSSYVARNPTSASAALYTNGYVVTLTAAGWIYGDAITVTSGTPSVTWTTLTASTGSSTGIGLVGASCTAASAVSATTVTANNLLATAGSTCPADFATIYTGTVPGTTTTLSGVTASTLVVGNPVQWTLTQPASTTSTAVGISISNNGGTAVVASTAAATTTAGGAQQYALSTLSYAFYVETAGTATVCFQTAAQHTASTSCGSVVTTSSAGILSATISGFVAMIALIFFN